MSAINAFMPGILRRLGKKHIEQATQWVPTAVAYGTTAAVGVIYATDWKLVLQYLPYYNGIFAENE